MPATTRYPSAETIAQAALGRQDKLLDQADALDTKAATLIGLIAVLLGLLLGSDFVLERWNVLVTLGAGLLVLATAVLAIGVYFPRKYLLNPDIPSLTRAFAARKADHTNWVIAQSVARSVPQIERVLSRKAVGVGLATGMVVIALGLIGGRLIYSIESHPVTNSAKKP